MKKIWTLIALLSLYLNSTWANETSDSDGDGFSDLIEISIGLNPNINEFEDRPLTLINEFPGAYKKGMLISPDGKHLYTGSGSYVYDINQETGSIENGRTTDTDLLYSKSVINSTGQYLYANNRFNENYLSIYGRDFDTGGLTKLATERLYFDIKELGISHDDNLYFTSFAWSSASIQKATLNHNGEFYSEGITGYSNPTGDFSISHDNKTIYLPDGTNGSKLIKNGVDEHTISTVSGSVEPYLNYIIPHPSSGNHHYIAYNYQNGFYISLVNDESNEMNLTPSLNNSTYIGRNAYNGFATDPSGRILYVATPKEVRAFRTDISSNELISAPEIIDVKDISDESGSNYGMAELAVNGDHLYVLTYSKILLFKTAFSGVDLPNSCN